MIVRRARASHQILCRHSAHPSPAAPQMVRMLQSPVAQRLIKLFTWQTLLAVVALLVVHCTCFAIIIIEINNQVRDHSPELCGAAKHCTVQQCSAPAAFVLQACCPPRVRLATLR